MFLSWAQELGRAGRDGNPAKATIFYSATNIEHGGAWIKGHLNNQEHCSRILNEFSESWKYVMSDVVNQCQRSSLLNLFGEEDKELVKHPKCCDVCEFTAESVEADLSKELQILYDAIQTLGSKGELKITQWIRGSGLAWTDAYNKPCMSYENSQGHSERWWRLFIHKCHVLGVVKKELKSIIKQSQHYGIQGVISKTSKGEAVLEAGERFMVPVNTQHDPVNTKSVSSSSSRSAQQPIQAKVVKKSLRIGKGSHGVATIKKLIEDEENWKTITMKGDYQLPGTFSSAMMQKAFYTPDCTQLPQSTANPHYL